MNDREAKALLTAEFRHLRTLAYADLVELLAGKRESREVAGPSGDVYHVELEGFWDDGDGEDLRVVASIDDGGLRALLPFTDSFTIGPTGAITDHSPA